MRNARVLSRRALAVVESDQPHELAPVAGIVDEISLATDALASALGTGSEPLRARGELLVLAERLDPFVLAPADWQVQSLVLLLRSLVVDLLEAAGTDPGEARAALSEL